MRYPVMRLVAVAAVILFGLSFGLAQTGAKRTTQSTAPGGHDHRTSMMDSCAKECSDCERACESCATHCAHMAANGKAEHLKTLQTCRDCASFCSAAAQITARHGPFA